MQKNIIIKFVPSRGCVNLFSPRKRTKLVITLRVFKRANEVQHQELFSRLIFHSNRLNRFHTSFSCFYSQFQIWFVKKQWSLMFKGLNSTWYLLNTHFFYPYSWINLKNSFRIAGTLYLNSLPYRLSADVYSIIKILTISLVGVQPSTLDSITDTGIAKLGLGPGQWSYVHFYSSSNVILRSNPKSATLHNLNEDLDAVWEGWETFWGCIFTEMIWAIWGTIGVWRLLATLALQQNLYSTKCLN